MSIEWTGRPRTSSVGTEIANYLEQLIRTGQLKPGNKIPPEREIAEKFGVSRTSVRQALHELTLKGLTDRKPGRGTVVTPLDSRAAELLAGMGQLSGGPFQVADLRQTVEPSVARRAAERVTPDLLNQLEKVLIQTLDTTDPSSSAELDEHFHLLVAHATQNPLLVTLVDLMKDWTSEVRRESHATESGRLASLAGHQRIYQAIKAGNADLAEKAMSDHIAEIESITAKPSSDFQV